MAAGPGLGSALGVGSAGGVSETALWDGTAEPDAEGCEALLADSEAAGALLGALAEGVSGAGADADGADGAAGALAEAEGAAADAETDCPPPSAGSSAAPMGVRRPPWGDRFFTMRFRLTWSRRLTELASAAETSARATTTEIRSVRANGLCLEANMIQDDGSWEV